MERKSVSLAAVQLKLEADGGGFVGYASTFGNIDSYGDTIVKGAYLKTLAQYGLPKMFFNHDGYEVPIGKWVKAEEDNYGLLLVGELTAGNKRSDEVRAALKHGTLDSLSIGYSLTKGGYDETSVGRTITEVARLREVSIVTYPADTFATIDLASVKSMNEELGLIESVKDFEYFLRDTAHFSKEAAQALVVKAGSLFARPDLDLLDSEKLNTEILARIKRFT